MEFIQWYTSGAINPGEGLSDKEYTRHAMFRFDSIDTDIFNNFDSPATERAIEEAKDRTDRLKENGSISKKTLYISHVISEDSDDEYKMECLHYFARLMGYRYIVDITLKNTEESYEDFSKRAKLEGLGNFRLWQKENTIVGKKV